MRSTSFDAGWTVRPKTSIFAALTDPTGGGTPVRLPHDAVIGLPRSAGQGEGSHTGWFPGGAFEYAKTFHVPTEHRDRRVTLELQGAYRDAVVVVNGDFAGQRPSGYATFRVALDPFLRYGEDNTVRVDVRTHHDSRWYSGAGLHRDVLLHVTDLVHVAADGVRITTPDVDDEFALVEVATTVENEGTATRTVELVTEVVDAHDVVVATATAPVTLRAGGSAVARERLLVPRPVRWDLENPHLYRVRTDLRHDGGSLDALSTTFGIRTLQLDAERGLRLNGRPVDLRGACIHHDNGILGAAAIGRAEERRVELLKAAGFNAVRSSHNPISQPVLDACDRLGVLVLDETFDVWTEAKSAFDYSLAFPEWWERDVEALVAKDFNHPSVIMYSIGNEIPETGSALGAHWGRTLAEKVRSLDDTRFVTNAVNGLVSTLGDVMTMLREQDPDSGGVNSIIGDAGNFMNTVSSSDVVTTRTAESFAVLDVAGINYGDSRYVGDRTAFPHRVILGTETFPAHIDVLWNLVRENPHVIGDFTWTGWDYLGEAGIGRVTYTGDGNDPGGLGAPYPWIAAWCGDIDITGFRRPVSYYRETVFGLRSVPYVAVHRPENDGRESTASAWAWSDSVGSWSWDVAPGTPVTVDVYSDAEEVELLLDGASLGRSPVGADRAFQATFRVPYAPGELVAVASSGGVERGRTALATATGPTRLTVAADRAVLRADDSDLSFVVVELRDDAGNLATHRDRPVTVTVSGPAVLQGLGSARPDQTEGYAGPTHTTFDGRVLAVVRPTGPGEVQVSVDAEGLPSAGVTLTVEEAPATGS